MLLIFSLLISVKESSKENEAVKLIRMKQSLVKMSESYLEMAHKCIHVFEAQRDVALALPDVHDSEIDQIKYTGWSIVSYSMSHCAI